MSHFKRENLSFDSTANYTWVCVNSFGYWLQLISFNAELFHVYLPCRLSSNHIPLVPRPSVSGLSVPPWLRSQMAWLHLSVSMLLTSKCYIHCQSLISKRFSQYTANIQIAFQTHTKMVNLKPNWLLIDCSYPSTGKTGWDYIITTRNWLKWRHYDDISTSSAGLVGPFLLLYI